MATATSSPGAEAPVAPSPVAELAAALTACAVPAVPLLVFRLPALERTAWRLGLRAARTIERRATAAFAAASARVLRAGDRIAHDRGSDLFVAALTAPTRDGHASPAPVDVRSASARIATSIEGLTRLDVDTGWTCYDGRAGGIEAALARALERGRQERERYAFFSALGHELRTPLASIRGYLETLLDDAETDGGTRRRFVRIAHGESVRLGRLLDGMFEISLLDLSASMPHASSGLLAEALAAAGDATAAHAARHGTEVRLPVLPALPVRVAIDGDRLALVLINVIDNAVKHSPTGGRVAVQADLASPRTVALTIDDDGPGIPPGDRERIFRFGERGATAAGGSGIGLALVRMLLERAGGRIDAEESPLGGARFRVTIPRHPRGLSRRMRRRDLM